MAFSSLVTALKFLPCNSFLFFIIFLINDVPSLPSFKSPDSFSKFIADPVGKSFNASMI
jgi:hypothetical protein